MLELELVGLAFEAICCIQVQRDGNGRVIEDQPHTRHARGSTMKLNRWGRGPFCEFHIPRNNAGSEGVYALLVDDDLCYVGECEHLARRFNQGYGQISPGACFEGGQSTNCHINHAILEAAKAGKTIRLCFHTTADRHAVEAHLLKTLQPPWNRQCGRKERRSAAGPGTKRALRSKYEPLGRYLAACGKAEVLLTFEQIERVLGFRLPASASRHAAWWSNGGQPHSHFWLDAGYCVDGYELDRWVRFRRK